MQSVQRLIGPELALFEQKFAASVKGSNMLLDRIMRFIIKRKGKQMRPMFVFLSAKIAGGINEKTYRAAALIELLHTATLVHDDVVDNSMLRRNFFSINALWKNKIAVLVGDYLLSKGLLLSVEHGDFRILEITSRAVKEMSEGELLQMEKARKLNISENIYFEIIRAKTASLLSSACSAGAFSASDDEQAAERFRLFGEKVGIAFQIKDDLFDYGAEQIGKPTGIDIKERKMTLPLIYTLQHADKATQRRIIYIVRNQSTNRKKVDEVIAEVQASGGITYAAQKMHQFKDEALELLHEYPESEARQAMEDLVHYAIDRRF
ncbi:MAG: polyprenyl synthetase family protein [Bacteroidetes bacterium]|nr:polyprenyl synthetase family protein [Bacteroidota bacterium]MBS1629668.1 polyprenyl synthetase family protein [Bacteroidota bacterium]